MKKTWMFPLLAMLTIASLLAGCSNAPAQAPKGTGAGMQIANPWTDATPARAAEVIGGTLYDLTTLDKAYERYAMMVTTDDAVKNGLNPTAWIRYRKGDEDVSLQMFMGGKPDEEQLKGEKTAVNGADAYIADPGDGTKSIVWEANGILYVIGTSANWSDDDLVKLAEGVKAVS